MPYTASADTVVRVAGDSAIYWKTLLIGSTVEGFTVRLSPREHDVPIDAFGKVPGEIIRHGAEAEVEGELIIMDSANLTTMLQAHLNLNVAGSIGTLVIASGLAGPLSIVTRAGGTISFAKTYLTDSYEVSMGVKRSTWRLKWRAIPGWNTATGHDPGVNIPGITI